MKWAIGFVAATLFWPVASRADQSDRFGSPNTIVPSGRIAFEIDNIQPPGGGDGATVYSFEFAPGMLYFVSRNLAVGGAILWTYSTTGSGDSRRQEYAFGIAPQVGFNVPLARTVSFFPTLDFTYITGTTRVGPSEEGKVRQSRGLIGFFAPFLFHFDNFFMGVGPFVRFDVTSKSRVGRLSSEDANKLIEGGLQTTLGGWF